VKNRSSSTADSDSHQVPKISLRLEADNASVGDMNKNYGRRFESICLQSQHDIMKFQQDYRFDETD